jgi:prevent-host-death family protein
MATRTLKTPEVEGCTVGIRALQQNASQVVARAAAGETITITDHGRPVAEIVPVGRGRLDALIRAGLASAPTASIKDWVVPEGPITSALSDELRRAREEERY